MLRSWALKSLQKVRVGFFRQRKNQWKWWCLRTENVTVSFYSKYPLDLTWQRSWKRRLMRDSFKKCNFDQILHSSLFRVPLMCSSNYIQKNPPFLGVFPTHLSRHQRAIRSKRISLAPWLVFSPGIPKKGVLPLRGKRNGWSGNGEKINPRKWLKRS